MAAWSMPLCQKRGYCPVNRLQRLATGSTLSRPFPHLPLHPHATTPPAGHWPKWWNKPWCQKKDYKWEECKHKYWCPEDKHYVSLSTPVRLLHRSDLVASAALVGQNPSMRCWRAHACIRCILLHSLSLLHAAWLGRLPAALIAALGAASTLLHPYMSCHPHLALVPHTPPPKQEDPLACCKHDPYCSEHCPKDDDNTGALEPRCCKKDPDCSDKCHPVDDDDNTGNAPSTAPPSSPSPSPAAPPTQSEPATPPTPADDDDEVRRSAAACFH